MPQGHDLAGKTVLVSGATGQVGRELLAALAVSGAKIGVAVRKPWQVALVGELLANAKQLVGVVDATDGEASAGLVKGVQDCLGPIDAFVSVAGAFQMSEAGADRTNDAYRLMEANYLSIANLVRPVIGAMRRRKAGQLVFTGADAVGNAIPGMSLYLASKAALHQYAECLHQELADQGVGVTIITPGIINTEANREAMPDQDHGAWLPVERVVNAVLQAAAGQVVDGPLFDPRSAG